MAQLRNFQFLRNNDINSFASYAAARTAAVAAFAGIGSLLDGEIALYSYKLNGDATTVHTLLGIKRTNGIEILGNYDELTAEYQSYVASEIAKLNSEKTDSNNGVSVTVKQVNGKIDSVSVIAPSLTAAIEALDVDPFYLTELNGTTLQRYQISEVDGKIVKGQTANTVLTFASAPTADNKVVTQAEIAALDTPAEGVSSAATNNVKVTVKQVNGIVNSVEVVDNSVNATDVTNAITTAIAELDSTKSNVESLANGTTTTDIRVEVVETDGKLTAVNVTDTLAKVAHSGKAADVTIVDEGNLYTATNVEAALAEVRAKANELDAAQLEAGTGIEIGTDNKINAKFDIVIETRTEGEGEDATTATYIVIKDGENVIAEEDANAFVKDGFLQKVELIEGTEEGETANVLRFTWNSDAGSQVTNIPVSDLCDVYTAKANDWIQLNGFEFSHKTSGVTADTYAANAADVTVNNTTSQSFKVPTLTVDAAGHVTAASEKTVTISLPVSINTAIQGGAGVNTTYIQTTVVRNATDNNQLDVTATAVIGSVANDTTGLAEATEVRDYVDSQIGALTDYNTETTVSAAENSGIIVTPTITGADTVNEQRSYAISLGTVSRVDNATAEGVAGNPTTSSFADDAKTFTYVKAVRTDANGRVLGIDTETVTENFDAGTY